MAVVIETTLGDLTVDLYTQERPQTCKNFLKLCKIKYYNFCLFHSVQANFLAQTGDPTGVGTGGESIYGIVSGNETKFYEAEKIPKIKHDKPGLLSMVNCGNNMLGSQFFVTLGSDLQSLEEHCVFAEVTEGHDVLIKLNDAICDFQHRPYQDIRITHTVILEDPFEDPAGLIVPDMSPDISQIPSSNGRIAADEKVNDEEGLTVAELEEMKADREAKARATILEIVGDLPDAEIAPPENVLFVCKLNPVTTDEDLEIIFSRFGKVKSCEVIRDHQTGDSLQYAFVEFEDQKSCEQAYFKMDNVLIDDRRIHVDFSQSVAKMKWRGKGRGVQYFDKPDERDIARTMDPRYSGSRRENYRERDRDRDRDRSDRRREDERRRRGGERDSEDHRRRERRKVEELRRRDDETWREEDPRWEEERKRREREERRRDDERRHNGRREERRRDDDRRRDPSDRRRNGTERREKEHARRYEVYSENSREDKMTDNKNREVHESREEGKSDVSRHNKDKIKKEENDVESDIERIKNDEKTIDIATLDSGIKDSMYEPVNSNMSIKETGKSSISQTKRKSLSSENKKKKRSRKDSTSSESSSSDSSDSSSSSSSVDRRKKSKCSLTVAKKYYQGGKLVKVVKKKKGKSSDSDSDSEESSDSDRKRKKMKKYKKKIIKVVTKKKRRHSSDESDSDSSSSDDSDSSKYKKRRRKNSKTFKKKKKMNAKKTKKKNRDSSESSDQEETEKRKEQEKYTGNDNKCKYVK